MSGINKVMLLGNLGKNPELSYTQSGFAKCKFSLATNESFVNKAGERQDRAEWHNVIVWGKQAEAASKFLRKGWRAFVEGRIQTRSYDDKDGVKKYITEIVADRVTFIGGVSDEPEEPAAPANNEPSDDDIPF
jgi:single-strand DNA-binding protein